MLQLSDNDGRSAGFLYASLVTHVFTASSTALDKSPFLPPNFSMALNRRFFSRSSGISTQIRPISTPRHFLCFFNSCARFARVRYLANKQMVLCLKLLLSLLSSLINPLAYPCSMIYAYPLISVSIEALNNLIVLSFKRLSHRLQRLFPLARTGKGW